VSFDPDTAMLDSDPDADSLRDWMKTASSGVKASDRQAAAEGIIAAFKGGAGSEDALREVLKHSAKVLPQAVRKGIRRDWYRAHAKDGKNAPDISDYWAKHASQLLTDGHFVGRGSWRDQAKRWLRGATEHVVKTTGVRADAPLLEGMNKLTEKGP